MLFSDMPLAPNTRVALRVEYHGGAFNGWQAQTKLDVPTVQEALEAGLSKIAAAPIKTSCAGRTDTGVHASGQIVHFDDPVGRSLKSWVFGTNSETPDSISIHWAGDVASGLPCSLQCNVTALSVHHLQYTNKACAANGFSFPLQTTIGR
jgi:tRNA pseudouridine38-40 synthase